MNHEQPPITFDSDFLGRARTSVRTALRGSDSLGDLLRVPSRYGARYAIASPTSFGYELTEDDVSSFARLAPNAGTSDDENLITRFSKCLCLLVGRLVGELQGFRLLSGEADVLVLRK